MQTKDLRYTPAKYTREHQRTYTLLDIAEGDSNTVLLSQAMQYADTVHAYDVTALKPTAITDIVSEWLLTGKSVWSILEHQRLQIRVVDSRRIALPSGFVGRVLIARATPDADTEAPELIRLGALLHRIQQEPTALRVWKGAPKPLVQHILDTPSNDTPHEDVPRTDTPRMDTPANGTSAGVPDIGTVHEDTTHKVVTRTVQNLFDIYAHQYTTKDMQSLGYKKDEFGNYPAAYPITKWVAAEDTHEQIKAMLPVYVDSRAAIVHSVQKPNAQESYWVVKLSDDY